MYQWQKLSVLIRPHDFCGWSVSHAMVPVAQWKHGDVYRVYFSSRDEKNRSLIGYVELDLNEPGKVVGFSKKPVLTLGQLGCFDDNGVTPSWLVEHEGKTYLYYIGWNKRSVVRMSLVAGLAVSHDQGESFERVWNVPILDRVHEEPYLLNTAPCVLKTGDIWKMWYVCGVKWVNPDLPKYHIRYTESQDGLHWKRPGKVCIDFKDEQEHAIARPCVLKENGIYKMWYSYKGENYRIGYAESPNGLDWKRCDEKVGITVSPSGWDSEMIEYAYVFNHKNKKYMLYNGNNYGFDGFGIAVAGSDQAGVT